MNVLKLIQNHQNKTDNNKCKYKFKKFMAKNKKKFRSTKVSLNDLMNTGKTKKIEKIGQYFLSMDLRYNQFPLLRN